MTRQIGQSPQPSIADGEVNVAWQLGSVEGCAQVGKDVVDLEPYVVDFAKVGAPQQ